MSDPSAPSWPPPPPGSQPSPPPGAPPAWGVYPNGASQAYPGAPAGPGPGPGQAPWTPPAPGQGPGQWGLPPSDCYAHPGRTAGAVCRRCGRPICPDCMREAPVGWQCASCVKKDSRTAPVTRWRPGAAPSARISPVVAVIVAACVVVYLWQQGHPGFEFKYGLSPFSLHYGHRWYEAITSAFLHASPLHILLNMMTLVIVGPTLERALGSVRFAAVYLISALGGSVGYYLLAPANSLAVGASGAIFGLLGAWFVAARLRGWPAQPMTGLLVINLLFSFTVSGIAWQAHIGGLVAGALAALGMEFTGRTRPTPTARVIQSVLTFVVLTGVMVVLLALPPGHVNVGS